MRLPICLWASFKSGPIVRLRASAECERALELDRNLADAHAQLGGAKISLGRAEDTEAHVQEALRLSPRDTIAYHWSCMRGRPNCTLARTRRRPLGCAGRSRPTGITQSRISFWRPPLARLGRLPEAQSEARTGLAINPTFSHLTRFAPDEPSDDPTAVAAAERIIDGMRKAGVPEQ